MITTSTTVLTGDTSVTGERPTTTPLGVGSGADGPVPDGKYRSAHTVGPPVRTDTAE